MEQDIGHAQVARRDVRREIIKVKGKGHFILRMPRKIYI